MDRKALRERQRRTPRERESSIFFLTGGGQRESKNDFFYKVCDNAGRAGCDKIERCVLWQ